LTSLLSRSVGNPIEDRQWSARIVSLSPVHFLVGWQGRPPVSVPPISLASSSTPHPISLLPFRTFDKNVAKNDSSTRKMRLSGPVLLVFYEQRDPFLQKWPQSSFVLPFSAPLMHNAHLDSRFSDLFYLSAFPDKEPPIFFSLRRTTRGCLCLDVFHTKG